MRYYQIDDFYREQFVKIPMVLFVSKRYNWISDEAKVLYARMYDIAKVKKDIFKTNTSPTMRSDDRGRFYYIGNLNQLKVIFTLQDDVNFDHLLDELKKATLAVFEKYDDMYKIYPLNFDIEVDEINMFNEFHVSSI
ncbi:hypothetical protein ACEUW8_11780 [Staphylococcus pseudintermedius]|uniref:Uncharacterized protein n=1 Tax=Staphylococcus pseudintermedius TaxID=283734 RepID=A0A8H9BZ12_STAPS|nr:hypothetical protein [Staphylococcus pseudintermedius]HEC2183158.1 hypothetical protein [Staphylococcus delphini]EGQ0296450.1 hypothetical protein [Staphylococcus pseudintermedius]EGQ0315048.1 hypothetical protein [Staphylococcus pseudintermedius]EGQ0319719.1 hypothetical protein [Staphylococcus pseudintermedius]EGQ0392396.1 hypothetical protein [Staphylococcus pseudintermedius]